MAPSSTPHYRASIAHLKSQFREVAQSVLKSAAKKMSENEKLAKQKVSYF
jgi:hypothetical protein